jgi:hypothetical protein
MMLQAVKPRAITATAPLTRTQSLALCKNLLRVTVSSVCYLRGLFGDKCFKEKAWAGLQVHSLGVDKCEERCVAARLLECVKYCPAWAGAAART